MARASKPEVIRRAATASAFARVDSAEVDELREIGFILLPGFPLMCFAAAVEPLRAANLLAGRELYRMPVFAPSIPSSSASTGSTVACSLGFDVPAERLPGRSRRLDSVFVCAGGSPAEWQQPGVAACLRELARRGVRIGGISGGAYVLAAAGLLDGYDFTIHWEHVPAMAEAFTGLKPRPGRFVVDRNRITCGGGVAPLDMMHALIAEQHGPDFARRVSDWFLHADVAAPAAPQIATTAQRYGVQHPVLLRVIEAMEAAIERPVSRARMATMAGISARHLDRLLADKLGTTYAAHYRRLRLQHARKLLMQSSLTVAEIAFATGFSSSGHFARQYKAAFGSTPRTERARRPATAASERRQ